MKTATATAIAIECMKKEIQRIAVDANLYDHGLAEYPAATTSSAKRKRILEAIEVIAGLGKQ